jgi:hypothetical protein
MRILRIALLSIILLLGYSKVTVPSGIDKIIYKYKETQALNFLELRRYEFELNRFIKQLGYDESRNNWLIINKYGALGEYQFIYKTLQSLGYKHITLNKFKKNPTIFPPELQKKVLIESFTANTITMNSYINEFEGTTIKGFEITKAGILAACHLGGPTSVKLFLNSNGRINKKDAFGTSIETYLKRYQIFNLQLKLI